MKGSLTAVFLSLSLVLPVTLSIGFLHYQKHLVRKAIKRQIIAGINRAELTLLKFTIEDSQTKLSWEHDSEFEYLGEMFDVVERSMQGDTIYYWCWPDRHETALNERLDILTCLVWGKDQKQRDMQDHLHDFFLKLYCAENTNSAFIGNDQTVKGYIYIVRNSVSIRGPSAPPPQII